jgi:hypothetical protein
VILTGQKGLGAYLAEYGGGASTLPEIAGMYHKRNLVVCGDAACIWDDLERFGCRSGGSRGMVAKIGWDFMVINRLGEVFPGAIAHWFSNAGALIKTFMAARRQEYAKEFTPPVHTHACDDGAMWRWPFNAQGTSALSGTLAGIGMGYEAVVLCGVPLDDGPHNGEPHWRTTRFASSEVRDDDKHWKRFCDVFKGKAMSMSGRTRDWLGEP